jgi:phage gpG-like protein
MIETTITVSDAVTPDIAKKIAELKNTRPLMRAVAEAMRRAMREHYAAQPPNTRGFPSKGFWKKEGVDRVAVASFDDKQATVVVDSIPMAGKFFGGTRTPTKAKALSIPISPEAYKVGSASLFPRDLTLIKRKGGKPPLLIEAKKKVWKIHYVLLKSVTVQADARAFPPRTAVEPVVTATITEKINLIWRVSQ